MNLVVDDVYCVTLTWATQSIGSDRQSASIPDHAQPVAYLNPPMARGRLSEAPTPSISITSRQFAQPQVN